MPDTTELINFLNDQTARDGDLVEITNAGQIDMKQDKQDPNKKYPQLNIGVRCNGRDLTWTPNSDAREVLNKKYGTKTENWVGKKFTVKTYPKTAFGQTTIAILPVLVEAEKI